MALSAEGKEFSLTNSAMDSRGYSPAMSCGSSIQAALSR